MKNTLRFLLLLAGIVLANCVSAQIVDPVKWKVTSKKISDCEYELQFTGTIDEHWHVYSLTINGDDGPMPAKISLDKSADFEAIGKATEGTPIKSFDKVFEVNVAYFEKIVTFKQKVRLKSNKDITVTGTYEYQACTEEKCIFPPATPFEFKFKGTAECEKAGVKLVPVETGNTSSNPCYCDSVALLKIWHSIQNGDNSANAYTSKSSEPTKKDSSATASVSQSSANNNDNGTESTKGRAWWSIFITGFLGGLAALLTPCVFPMIPMTVSFFTKRSKTRATGITNALIYGSAIIVIYVLLGLGVTSAFGPDALNALSTNVWFNLAFFALLVVFAISFLGAFEIVLPSGFVNKIDAKSDKGGLIGIFFMAFTLALVSFSCTGPIIGTLLVDAAVNGGIRGPFWGMFGFSAALALPFGLFAAFPGWLNSLPKSGGWLNSVKVVLGFLELALALKFASNADLVVQAGIITREIFIALWIVIFGLMGIYLMGWIKFSHDSPLSHLSVTRLFFAIFAFSFTIYLVPGLWGAPLKMISGFPPPDFYSESPGGFGGSKTALPVNISGHGIASDRKAEHCPNELPCFHDYDEALAYAKKVGKPLMIDFTGWACVNCRKMESQVWPDPEVDRRIRNEVVLVSLYVDDKNELPADQQVVKKLGDRDFKIKTIGNKWSYMQANVYQTNSQPQYILVDHNEKMLTQKTAHYDPDIKKYINWLDEGINEFKKRTGK
ncbi:MAG TPA: cytochrome c biogenesis protein CcdA [Bacteroidia bacterium]|jgi:thiol:disulfide interchange protein DsbD